MCSCTMRSLSRSWNAYFSSGTLFFAFLICGRNSSHEMSRQRILLQKKCKVFSSRSCYVLVMVDFAFDNFSACWFSCHWNSKLVQISLSFGLQLFGFWSALSKSWALLVFYFVKENSPLFMDKAVQIFSLCELSSSFGLQLVCFWLALSKSWRACNVLFLRRKFLPLKIKVMIG